ncbi:MAG: methyltransferase family protein [Thermodesulfobacteriota bacterium]
MPQKARHIKRRRSKKITPIPIMQMISGFWASKTLASAVELELFTNLSGRGGDVRDISRLLGINHRPAEMLLSACAALGLLDRSGVRFYNSSLAEEYLVKG